ncbi:hypothetical protein E2C01_036039 [Portunus trituberculatus]|uniref:Uncharacterized protein n=1 Tax=Portunus trituberculatus TaxID=210409 RepID=A0A5B7FBD2_PORTR|nr:hypothetical protein [Portunus trituberculatus]
MRQIATREPQTGDEVGGQGKIRYSIRASDKDTVTPLLTRQRAAVNPHATHPLPPTPAALLPSGVGTTLAPPTSAVTEQTGWAGCGGQAAGTPHPVRLRHHWGLPGRAWVSAGVRQNGSEPWTQAPTLSNTNAGLTLDKLPSGVLWRGIATAVCPCCQWWWWWRSSSSRVCQSWHRTADMSRHRDSRAEWCGPALLLLLLLSGGTLARRRSVKR